MESLASGFRKRKSRVDGVFLSSVLPDSLSTWTQGRRDAEPHQPPSRGAREEAQADTAYSSSRGDVRVLSASSFFLLEHIRQSHYSNTGSVALVLMADHWTPIRFVTSGQIQI
ncbi:Hypothetical predicted protein [Marmota monax]|uniref:Uncharacterized protein n=1 Tax=Marmota monax TaxID=9995 RepID=A0A5E4AZN1_MARMO|nr:hypothetical protein GHT09_017710 [Marmota monax]VTJ62844.1 Hypothetical predicted protein [Marmota monax]